MTIGPQSHGLADALHQINNIAAAPAGYREHLSVIALHAVQIKNLRQRHMHRSLRAYWTLTIDGHVFPIHTNVQDNVNPVWKFDAPVKLCVYPSSTLKFTVHRDGKIEGAKVLGEYEAPLLQFLTGDLVPFKMISHDSPDSTIGVSMKVREDWEPVPNMLCYARDRAAEARTTHTALPVFDGILKGLQTFRNVTSNFAKVHPVAHVAHVFLDSVYKVVEQHIEVDKEILALIKTMKEVLDDANYFVDTHSVFTEDLAWKIVQWIAEGAALIDEWNHAHFNSQAQKATKLAERVTKCGSELKELQRKIPLVLQMYHTQVREGGAAAHSCGPHRIVVVQIHADVTLSGVTKATQETRHVLSNGHGDLGNKILHAVCGASPILDGLLE